MLPLHRLVLEMLVVGTILAVFGAVVDLVVTRGRIRPTYEVMLRTAVAGALFHAMCDVTGVNDWYCTGYSAQMR